MAKLLAVARSQGAAPVTIHLVASTLKGIERDVGSVRRRAAEREATLLRELGGEAWGAGRWRNGFGQVELYLTEAGLRILSASGQAISFWPGRPWSVRLGLDPSDYRVAAVEQRLQASGKADVLAMPMVQAPAHELDAKGRLRFTGQSLLAARTQLERSGLAALRTDTLVDKSLPESGLRMQLNRKELLQLIDSGPLLALQLVDQADPRPFELDPEAQRKAERDGDATIIVTLRQPLLNAMSTAAAAKAQDSANRQAFQAVASAAGIPAARLQPLPHFGTFIARVSPQQLQALSKLPDGRLLSIQANRPVASLHLSTSTPTMNMASAWNAGYKGQDQGIVVMDSGAWASHPFYRNAAGISRVTYEACFGSNEVVAGISYTSSCPQADANGDSPLGLPGSAAPMVYCSLSAPNACVHGDHVAGIAMGRNEPGAGTGVQGVAPEANLIAVKVSSHDADRFNPPRVFSADLLMGLQAVVNATTPGRPDNPLTVNMSLGSGANPGPCSHLIPGVSNAIQSLKQLGVPVVTTTGNAGLTGLIGWPACVPGTIQVSSTANDGVGNTRTSDANLATGFPASTQWVAPGGGNSTQVRSSVGIPGEYYRNMSGTSQAAPHISGLYAAAKAAMVGATVDDVTAWFRGNAAVALVWPYCPGGGACSDTATFYRVQLPPL